MKKTVANICFVSILFTFLGNSYSFADEGDRVVEKILRAECPECQLSIPQCTQENTVSPDENFQCVTSKGGLFKRVLHPQFGMSWMLENGVVWSDIIVDSDGGHDFTQDFGVDYCAKLSPGRNIRLANVMDYKLAQKDGFLQVFSHFRYGDTHWTSDMKDESSFFGIAVTVEGDERGVLRGIRFFPEQHWILPFEIWNVKFKIRCVDDQFKR